MEGEAKAKEILKQCCEKMDAALQRLQEEFSRLRAGRASVGLVDHILIPAYEDKLPLKQLASITTPDAVTIQITPYDKTIIKSIEKGIADSQIGLTPINDGSVIRINIPPMTEERRKDVIKVAGKIAEEGRVALRNNRRDAKEAFQKLEKSKEIGEDEYHFLLDELEKELEKRMEKLEELYRKKETEIMNG